MYSGNVSSLSFANVWSILIVTISEIHLSDLLRAHEANTDFLDDDPSHIHWAKFNMIGRFIDAIAQCQASCRETRTYEKFPEDVKARELLLFNKENLLMDEEARVSQFLKRTHID